MWGVGWEAEGYWGEEVGRWMRGCREGDGVGWWVGLVEKKVGGVVEVRGGEMGARG